MLSRVAEHIYWFARYLERAENSARLVNVNANLLLDLPAEYRPGWLPLIDITGSRELFDRSEHRGEERDIVHFLIAELDNPGSILASLRFARENARTLRDVLPNEVWEHLNELFMEVTEELPAALNKRMRFKFLQKIIRTPISPPRFAKSYGATVPMILRAAIQPPARIAPTCYFR
jgi:uncharacterized alpha-E superfamily protein